jgi:curli biogenesis system outer membrane secretion channel CsgG
MEDVMRSKAAVAGALLALPSAVFPSSAQSKRSLAVNNFEYSTVATDVQAVFGTNINIGKDIKALLVNRTAAPDRFIVVERTNIDTILKEQDFGNSGHVRKGTQAQIGEIRRADYVISGDIVTFGRDGRRKTRISDGASRRSGSPGLMAKRSRL